MRTLGFRLSVWTLLLCTCGLGLVSIAAAQRYVLRVPAARPQPAAQNAVRDLAVLRQQLQYLQQLQQQRQRQRSQGFTTFSGQPQPAVRPVLRQASNTQPRMNNLANAGMSGGGRPAPVLRNTPTGAAGTLTRVGNSPQLFLTSPAGRTSSAPQTTARTPTTTRPQFSLRDRDRIALLALALGQSSRRPAAQPTRPAATTALNRPASFQPRPQPVLALNRPAARQDSAMNALQRQFGASGLQSNYLRNLLGDDSLAAAVRSSSFTYSAGTSPSNLGRTSANIFASRNRFYQSVPGSIGYNPAALGGADFYARQGSIASGNIFDSMQRSLTSPNIQP